MDLIGKVNGTRVLRQRTHCSIRCEDVDFLSQIALLDRVNEVLGIVRLVLQLHQLLDPVHPDSWFFAVYLSLDTFLVSPVGRNPILSDLMHFLGPNLKLNRTFGSINGRMDRLVTIGLAIGNVILEPPRHRPPKLMNIAQHGINITLGI